MYNMQFNRFKTFILNEKVTAAQAKEALKDPNITLGVEFEFISKAVKDGVENDEGDSNVDLERDYRNLVDEMDEVVRDVENSREEWESEQIEEKDEKIDEYNIEIRQLENKISDLNDDIEQHKSDIEEYEAEEEADESGETDNQDSINDLNDEISELEGVIDRLQDEIYDNQSEIDEIENLDAQEWNTHNGDGDGFYYEGDYSATPSDDLMNWWLDYRGLDSDDIQNAINEYCYYDDDYAWNRIDEPDENDREGRWSSEPDGSEWVEATEEYFDFDNLPSFVNPYEVMSYHDNENYKGWKIEEDGSVTAPGNVEIVTVPFKITEVDKIVGEMCDYINIFGETDSSCGMHLNMSYKGKKLVKELDLLKLMLFIEEGQVIKEWPDRKHSSYAKSMLFKVNAEFAEAQGKEAQDRYSKEYWTFRNNKLKPMFNKFVVTHLPSKDKYNSVNWNNIDNGDTSRIEIRWIGGENYTKNYNKLKNQIGKFAHYLKLALDPDYMKEEYAKKLWRLITKLDPGALSTDPLKQRQDEEQADIIEEKGIEIGVKESILERGLVDRYYAYSGYIWVIGSKNNNRSLKKLTTIAKFEKSSYIDKYFRRNNLNWNRVFGLLHHKPSPLLKKIRDKGIMIGYITPFFRNNKRVKVYAYNGIVYQETDMNDVEKISKLKAFEVNRDKKFTKNDIGWNKAMKSLKNVGR